MVAVPTDFAYDHHRADWVNPAEPVRGPAPFPWSTADRIAIHYTAALNLIDGDPGENWAGLPAYLRAIHHDYLTNPDRGYSIGYGIAVDQRGHTWQLRGVTWRNAANLNWNHRTLAILSLVDAADQFRYPEAVAAVRRIVAWFRSQSPYGDGVRIVGHRDIGATACPGNGIYSQITSHVFEPVVVPDPPPPTLEVSMLIVDHNEPGSDGWDSMTFTGTHLAHLNSGTVREKMLEAGVPAIRVVDVELMGLITSSATTTECPPTIAQNPTWKSAWDRQRAA